MGLFDLFKKKPIVETPNIEQTINFETNSNPNDFTIMKITIQNVEPEIYEQCILNDYVNLWTKDNLDRVHIYARGGIGGTGRIGFIPNEYFKNISSHILSEVVLDENKTDNGAYYAEIINKENQSITLEISLFSPERQKADYLESLKEERKNMAISLQDDYIIKKPIKLDFRIKNPEEPYVLENLSVNLGTKDFYIENPQYCFIQLLDENRKLVAEINTPKDKVFKIIRAFHGGNIKRATILSGDSNFVKMEFASTED